MITVPLWNHLKLKKKMHHAHLYQNLGCPHGKEEGITTLIEERTTYPNHEFQKQTPPSDLPHDEVCSQPNNFSTSLKYMTRDAMINREHN